MSDTAVRIRGLDLPGFRSALLPDTLLPAEPAHSWEHGRIALVPAAWGVAAFVLCLTTFRWKRGRDA